MGDFSRLLAIPEEITVNGKTYKLAPHNSMEVIGEFELFFERRAMKKLLTMRDLFSPQEFEIEKQALLRAIDAGMYSYFTPDAIWGRLMPMSPVFKESLLMRLRIGNPNNTDVNEQLANTIIEQQLEELMILVEKENAKKKAAETEADGESKSQPSSPVSSESPTTSASQTSAA